MEQQVVVGTVLGPFGVRGWVKVRSYTSPIENILTYTPWYLDQGGCYSERVVLDGKRQGNVVIVDLEGVIDRDQAVLLQNVSISVTRSQFPSLEPERYYWADLIGLQVENVEGISFGKVSALIETGANDVIETTGERKRLIPFISGHFVKEVRLHEGIIIVDWDPEF